MSPYTQPDPANTPAGAPAHDDFPSHRPCPSRPSSRVGPVAVAAAMFSPRPPGGRTRDGPCGLAVVTCCTGILPVPTYVRGRAWPSRSRVRHRPSLVSSGSGVADRIHSWLNPPSPAPVLVLLGCPPGIRPRRSKCRTAPRLRGSYRQLAMRTVVFNLLWASSPPDIVRPLHDRLVTTREPHGL